MVKLIGGYRLQEGQIVHGVRQMGKVFAEPGPTFSVLGESGLGGKHFRYAADERKFFTLQERGRTVQPIEFKQFGFVVKEFQLGGRSGHMQVDHRFCLASKLRKFRRQRIGGIKQVGRCSGMAARQ